MRISSLMYLTHLRQRGLMPFTAFIKNWFYWICLQKLKVWCACDILNFYQHINRSEWFMIVWEWCPDQELCLHNMTLLENYYFHQIKKTCYDNLYIRDIVTEFCSAKVHVFILMQFIAGSLVLNFKNNHKIDREQHCAGTYDKSIRAVRTGVDDYIQYKLSFTNATDLPS